MEGNNPSLARDPPSRFSNFCSRRPQFHRPDSRPSHGDCRRLSIRSIHPFPTRCRVCLIISPLVVLAVEDIMVAAGVEPAAEADAVAAEGMAVGEGGDKL